MPNNPASDIDKAKKAAIDGLNDRVGSMTSEAYRIALAAIESIFTIDAGKIVVDRTFIKQLNKLTIAVLDLAQSSPKFTGPVSGLIRRLPAIADAITEFQADVNGVKVPAYAAIKKVIEDEIIDKMLNNGLNTNFAQPLRNLLYQNATGGLSMNAAREQIKTMTATTGKLGSYIEQTAQQATSAYSGMISTKLLERFDYDGLLMTGSLIDNSSPQCRYVIDELGGRITRKDWPKVKAIAVKNGLIDGTTFDNLPQNLMHHGCRHSFYPIIIKKAA